MLNKKKLLGVGITDATQQKILEYLVKNLENSSKKVFIVTPNPEILVFAKKNPEFKKVLNTADLALCDGMGLVIAGKFLGKAFKERFTGTDFVEKACKEVSEKPITVGFLGGGPFVAEKTGDCLLSKYPSLKVVFTAEEWGEKGFILASNRGKTQNLKQNESENQGQLSSVPSVPLSSVYSIDILFVAFGFPKQEEWIYQNLDNISVKAAIGVGGAFDYISGKVPRAPKWVQALGFEWLYRLVVQPWRLKRQLALLEFIYLVLKERVRVIF